MRFYMNKFSPFFFGPIPMPILGERYSDCFWSLDNSDGELDPETMLIDRKLSTFFLLRLFHNLYIYARTCLGVFFFCYYKKRDNYHEMHIML